MAFASVAFAEADHFIPQCDRAHDHCMKRAVDIRSAFACRKARKWCRAATIDEATMWCSTPSRDGLGGAAQSARGKVTSAARRLAAGSLHAADALPLGDRLLMPANNLQHVRMVQATRHAPEQAERFAS